MSRPSDQRRAAVIVIDACGAGALPDAADYGDPPDANTLAHVAEGVGGLHLPTLERLGLGSIVDIEGVPPAPGPVLHGRLHPLGPGKDSTTGHWELMGVVTPAPLPTYPAGFPNDVVERLRELTGRGVLCNAPANGVEAIERFGAEHVRTGDLIVYTSVDSVLQVAAHVDVVPTDELYADCSAIRAAMTGEHAVGRVIARPFEGEAGAFRRTHGRRDYSVRPPGRSYLEELTTAGVPVHTVGKVAELFAGVGIAEAHPGPTNAIAIRSIDGLLDRLDGGLVFANLVETDQVY